MIESQFDSIATPLSSIPALSQALGVDLLIKRDDLYPFPAGGNKARKISKILQMAQQVQANALVTAGGTNSNHARVVALSAAMLGWKASIVIHTEEKELYARGNLLLMHLAGAKLRKVKMEEVKQAMDQEMEAFHQQGFNPYYIWGGGHSNEGTDAFHEAVIVEFKKQAKEWIPDYVIVASGTGSTHAGLHTGFDSLSNDTKVIGISVARDKARGTQVVEESIKSYTSSKGIEMPVNKVDFRDEWTGGGYEEVYPELIETIQYYASEYGLVLDPTYTAKAFYGLTQLIKKDAIRRGSKVLFWHTGGLPNLLYNVHLNKIRIA